MLAMILDLESVLLFGIPKSMLKMEFQKLTFIKIKHKIVFANARPKFTGGQMTT